MMSANNSQWKSTEFNLLVRLDATSWDLEIRCSAEKRGGKGSEGEGWGLREVKGEGQRKEGVWGSDRGPYSVPTLLITVSLETERGLPLALGNLLGPVAERGSSDGGGGWEGRGQRRGGKEGWNLKVCLTQELFPSAFLLVLPQCVHTRGELLHPSPPLPCYPNLSPPTHFLSTLLHPQTSLCLKTVHSFLFTLTFPFSFLTSPYPSSLLMFLCYVFCWHEQGYQRHFEVSLNTHTLTDALFCIIIAT